MFVTYLIFSSNGSRLYGYCLFMSFCFVVKSFSVFFFSFHFSEKGWFMLKGPWVGGDARKRLYVMAAVMLLIVLMFMGVMDFKKREAKRWVKNSSLNDHSPGVYYVVVQTKPSPGWCRMLLSSVLTNVRVATVGAGAVYVHAWRWAWIRKYMLWKRMQDNDVMVIFDGGDTFFSEAARREEAIEYFMSTTPSTRELFSEEDTLHGKVAPPLLFAAEKNCHAPQTYIMTGVDTRKVKPRDMCMNLYEGALAVSTKEGTQALLRETPSGESHLNGGGMIARVWALKEALEVFFALKRRSFKWWCDQSMWTMVFIWSVTRPKHANRKLLLRRGIMSLDYETRYFHYPSGVPVKNGMILHFPGPPAARSEKMLQFINETSWYRALRDSSTQREAYKYLLERYTTEIHTVWGSRKYVKFSTVCNVSNAANPRWLIGPLNKK
ncbi:expression site-associated (ESAG) protein [Trypanosoma brucei equiperdum]|uniref:Expression site-associated (ESAG) protein n=1 Tax=Trypanosoma brucei equiperdum TaxID=630700 RepID=A0A3L6L1B4_9TRYP|nr:expression site-associated (ESAG) protein [Trypanosoma brucei equiperdum]